MEKDQENHRDFGLDVVAMVAQQYECIYYGWNVHLKMIMIVNFMFHGFCHNKKCKKQTEKPQQK